MGFLERLQGYVHGARDYPPPSVAKHWEEVALYRARYQNDAAALFQYNASFNHFREKVNIYTPLPLAREMARLSASLLFSEPPKITHERYEEDLAAVLAANGVEPFLHAAAETIAAEGRGAIRVIFDEEISEEPLLIFVHEDQILWDERHGRFVVGGAVFVEKQTDRDEYYRLVEEHGAGYVERTLYKGHSHRLGRPVDLGAEEVERKVPEFVALEPYEITGLNVPTLIRWDNVPGGYSDYAGVEVLLDRLDEAETLFTDKGRKSVPVTFAEKSLASEEGVSFAGIVFSKQGLPNLAPPDGRGDLAVATVQPGLQSADHVLWVGHLLEMALLGSGYSLASYGLDKGGSADSGKALKLRQSRTLLSKASKDRMAKEAITTALAVALAWRDGASSIDDYRPEVKLGDGQSADTMEDAVEIGALVGAESLSIQERVKRLHPGWEPEDIEEEVRRIKEDTAEGPDPLRALGLGGP